MRITLSSAPGRRRLRATLLLLAAVLLAGCATTEQSAEPPPIPTWPEDDPRFTWEATLRNSHDVFRETDADRLRSFLTGEMPRIELGKPFGVAARGGRVYVSDTTMRRIHVFDAARKRYFQMGFRFEGKVVKPLGVAVDARGLVYVADGTRRTVIVYDGLGLFRGLIGDPDDLVRPTSVAVNADGSRIYVVDTGGVASDRHRVLVYAADGGRLGEIGGRGSGDGQFNLPVDAAVAADGTLYVLDAGNFRIQAFDPEGRFLRAWGSVGRSLGQLARPRGIAVGPQGNIYVADSFFGNVQIFNPQGDLLLPVGQSGNLDEPGRYALSSDVAVDDTGRLYILDQLFRKIDVIRPVRPNTAGG